MAGHRPRDRRVLDLYKVGRGGSQGPYEAHDAARGFLAAFGGLTTYGWPADFVTTSSAICFDPLQATWQDERFARAGLQTGVPLCPVGTANEGPACWGSARTGPCT
ncbi:SUKH-3 domain-containing protein [Streptomyces tendae]